MVSLDLGVLTQDFNVSSRRFAAIVLMVSGTLAWFFLLNLYLNQILTNLAPSFFLARFNAALFFGISIFSAILGSFICEKVNRRNFLFSWVVLGVISTVSLDFFQGAVFSAISSILLGFSLGLGLPSSLALLADCTGVEERGRVSGTTILVSFLLAFLTLTAIGILDFELDAAVILIAVVRAASFLALSLDKCDRKKVEGQSRLPKPDYRRFASYLSPWVMFVIASSIASSLIPQTEAFLSVFEFGQIFRYAFIALFGFFWGFVADRVGRKQPIIIGLVVLGISFALLGFAMSPNSVFIYLALSGIAWGAFLTIYLVIPGDLSIPGSREKFYTMGTVSPLIILFSLSMLASVLNASLASTYSQIVSAILFLSIIPVLRAKETLRESEIQERRMKEHVRKIIQESKKSE